MRTIAPDYLDQLGLPRNASRDLIEFTLAAQEARCQVLLKIPIKRAEGAARLELIAAVRAALNGASNDLLDLLPDFDTPPPFPAAQRFDEREAASDAPIVERETLGGDGALGEIRGAVNRWASAIPHHEYIAFGNSIEITAAELSPIYFARVTTLVERRALVERTRPYYGEALPRAQAREFSPWTARLPEKRGYLEESCEHEIAESRRRSQCPRCLGQAEMWCTACQSTGLVVCAQCRGRYQFECQSCGGSGTGASRAVNCAQCRGVGVLMCASCRDGWCQCQTCRGYRRITCSECAGRGEVLASLTVQAGYRPNSANITIFPDHFPDYARKRFDGARYQAGAPLALRAECEQEGDEVEAAIEGLAHRALRERLAELRKKTAGALTADERICRQLVEVRNCRALRVAYRFEERDYELWVVEGDVYARTSPVQEYDQKMARQAAQALASGDITATLERLSNAFLHTPNSAAALVVLNDCVKRVAARLEAGESFAVTAIADDAERLLGAELAVNLTRLGARAARKMRLEYSIAGGGAGFVALAVALTILAVGGDIYALDVALASSAVFIALLTGVAALLLAVRLPSRATRAAIAAAASMVAVIAGTLIGLALQDEYVSRQKREALTRYGRGDYQSAKSAIEPLEAALWTAPRDFELQLLLGRAYVRATYYEKAVTALTTALELSGGRSAEAHNELGMARLGKGERAPAAEHFRRAIALKAPEIYVEAYQNLARTMDMVYINGGRFIMGRNDGASSERPAHAEVVEPFFIDRYEVTNQQYLEFARATGRAAPAQWGGGVPPAGRESWPVTGVSLEDARAYARWRAERDKLGYRLPSEAEWEFAARGDKNRLYPWGNEWQGALANIKGGDGRLIAVGSYAAGATPEGVEDLIGNAAEWVDSRFAPYPGGIDRSDAGELWVIRGGAYDHIPGQVNASTRASAPAQGGDYHNVGFRCVLAASAIKLEN